MTSKWVTYRLRYRNYETAETVPLLTLDCQPRSKHSRMSNQEVAYSRMLRNSLTTLSPFPFKACSERIIAFYFLAFTTFPDENFWPPLKFANMLDRVLRGGDWELVKQRNKLKNYQTNYRTKLPDKSSSPEAFETKIPSEQRIHFRCMSWRAKRSLCRQPFNFLSCMREIRHAIRKQN